MRRPFEQGADCPIDIERLRAALAEYGAERAIVFGSYARGDWDELSDVDLVILKRTDAPYFRRLADLAPLLPPGRVEAFVYTPEEFEAMRARGSAFAETVDAEGVLLYERT